jgi:diguanylate cyclase (GGDEF)-like protein
MTETVGGDAAPTNGHRLRGGPALLLSFGTGIFLVFVAFRLAYGSTAAGGSQVGYQLAACVEAVLALGCLGWASFGRPRRGVAIALGAGLLAWVLGDLVWASSSAVLSLSATNGLSLLFFPLALVSLLLLARSDVGRPGPGSWLDGAIAGMGAAAICTAVTLGPFSEASGSSRTLMIASASALLLFALAMGVVALAPAHPGRTVSFAAGSALLFVACIVLLHRTALVPHQTGALPAALQALGFFAMTAALWLRTPDRPRPRLIGRLPRTLTLVTALGASTAILILGNLQAVSPLALGFAGATLFAGAARMAVSLREQKALNEARQHQAVTDELTGLGNRRMLLTELDAALSGAHVGGTPAGDLALLLIDLDHFKEINDSFGHQTGDALLRQIGPRIRQVVRRNDLVTRLGGDEFAVLLYGADAYKATTVARRITTLLEQPIDVSTASLHVGASIGVALAPEHARTADDLLRCADIAMYRAKSERGSFDVYEAALDDEADRFTLIEDLRTTMERGGLALHYQPQIDLRTGEVITVEALLRWPHPTLGLIPPEHLLALAEESGLIQALASWVFTEAIGDCARWWHAGHRAAVAVNLLATDLLDSSLPHRVAAMLAEADLPNDALVLEITEGMVVADLTRSKRVIQSLAEAGILVSIDDFGTGFSSISHLNDLAVGELKLDRTFTSSLQVAPTGEGRDENLVRSVIALGHALGLRVVAEGIERLEFISVLSALGCDGGQGYAIQAPCPADQIEFDGHGLCLTGATSAGQRDGDRVASERRTDAGPR